MAAEKRINSQFLGIKGLGNNDADAVDNVG